LDLALGSPHTGWWQETTETFLHQLSPLSAENKHDTQDYQRHLQYKRSLYQSFKVLTSSYARLLWKTSTTGIIAHHITRPMGEFSRTNIISTREEVGVRLLGHVRSNGRIWYKQKHIRLFLLQVINLTGTWTSAF